MQTTRRLISLVLLGSAIVLFAACDDDGNPSESVTTSTGSTTAPAPRTDGTTAESVTTSTGSTAAPAPRTQPFFGVGELHSDWSTGRGTGSGIASPIGEWTYEVMGATAASTEATGTITTENGDRLYVDITTTVVPGAPPPNARNRFVMEITGGTGQYENASGTCEGEVQEQSVEGSLVNSTVWWRGTITH